MPHSMTGFGRSEARGPTVRLQCEIRSVNHRFLTLKQRLPGFLLRFEPWLDGRIRKRVKRGTVEVHVMHQALSEAAVSELNQKAADQYLKTFRGYLKSRKLDVTVPAELLFGLPGVLVPPDPSQQATAVKTMLGQVVDQAMEELVAMRLREGERLEKALLRETKALRECVNRIGSRTGRVQGDYRKKLRNRVDAFLSEENVLLDAATLAREVAVYSDKTDITEELDRLASHLDEFDKTLGGKGPIGRALDFLVQEISREVQTVGSKVQDQKLTSEALKAKSCVEKLREQVQNLE